MLTVDFDLLGVGPGTKVIDVGCGAGRHASRRTAAAPTSSHSTRTHAELENVDTMLQAMADAGEAPRRRAAGWSATRSRCRTPTARSTA